MTEVRSTEDLIVAFLEGDDPHAIEEMLANNPAAARSLFQRAGIEQGMSELPLEERKDISHPTSRRWRAVAAAAVVFLLGFIALEFWPDPRAVAPTPVVQSENQEVSAPGTLWNPSDPFVLSAFASATADNSFPDFSLLRPLPTLPRTWEEISLFNFSIQEESNLTFLQFL
ncbi:MAG: hypothetical protein AAGJ79_06185 [Verrucomicrobiota bacterium]